MESKRLEYRIKINNETYEQIYVSKILFGDGINFIKENITIQVAFDGDEPELTRGEQSGQTTAASGSSRAHGGIINKEETQRRLAECYLLLRVEKLGDFRGMKLDTLVKLAEKLRMAGLADDDYSYLKNLMAKVKTVRPEFSIKNLQAIYACNYWINYFQM